MLKKLINLYQKHAEVYSYLFWGVLTTVINIVIYTVLNLTTSINYQINNVIAWIISALFAYFTNRKYVFHSNSVGLKNYFREMASFMLGGRLGSLILENIILYIGISLLGFNFIIVKVIGEIFVVIFNYFWSKLMVFK